MHFRKRALSVILVLLLAVVSIFASRFEMKPKVEKAPTELVSDKETLYLWYSDDALTNYLSSAAVAFGERENCRVLPLLTAKSEYLESINAATLYEEFATPDVYIINNDSLERAYLAGLAIEAPDGMDILNTSHFPRTALSAVTYKGKTVAYPLYFETSTLLFNKTYLDLCMEQINKSEEESTEEEELASSETEEGEEEKINWSELITEEGVPITLEGLLQISNVFDAPEQVDGVFEWNVSDIFYNYWFIGSYIVVGGEAGDDKSQIDLFNENTVAALAAYQNMNSFFSIESDKITTDECIQDFIDGKILFTLATSDQVKQLKAAVEDGSMEYEYGFANMPQISTELGTRSMSVTNAIAINGYSTHKELADKFAAFLSEEYTESMYERTGKISASNMANTDNPELQVFFEEYKKSVSLPKMMEIGNLWLQLEALFSKVWDGEEITPILEDLQNQLLLQLSGA